ncbi:ornithine cyclodeaminase family protein [Acidobacteriota bacterium]
MTEIYHLEEIKKALEGLDPIRDIEEGFIAYSQGKVVVPPVGELIFDDPPGGVHIKYGYIKGDEYYVIKIAGGFPDNKKLNLSTNIGLMLVFSQKTGALVSILLDDAYLTNVRTAAAGAVVAKYMAPKHVPSIGILGAGTQGRMQLEYLRSVIETKDVFVWGLTQEELDAYKADMESAGYTVHTTLHPEEIAANCNLIVTATPSESPLLQVDHIKKGTHITAVGSDTQDKIELDPRILKEADVVVADSKSQSLVRGEIYQAMKAGLLEQDRVVELGDMIVNKDKQRTSEDQITVADLTGVAIQDIQISKAVYKALQS